MNAQAPSPEHAPPDAQVVDSTADEEPGRELAVRPPSSAVTARIVSGHEPSEIIAHASAIATDLDKLVKAQGFAKDLGGNKPHLEIAAWQALGSMLGALGGEALHPETVWSRPIGERTTYHVLAKKFTGPKGNRVVESTREYDVEGFDWEARVEIRTAAGVVVGVSEAMCSRSEPSWMQKPDPAVRSMAETRAASRAFRSALGWIVAMAGYNPTPAEEMADAPAPAQQQQQQPAAPPFGAATPPDLVVQARQAIAYLLDPANGTVNADDNVVGLILNEIENATEQKSNAAGFAKYLPAMSLGGIVRVERAARKRREPAPAQESPGPETETEEEQREREEAEQIVAEAQAEAPADFT